MSAWRTVSLAVAVALFAPCAVAQEAVHAAAAAPAATLAGEYHLDGVMETGSGLRLHGDGRFEWFFSYGALDLAARGRWTRVGDGIDLAVDEMQFPPQMPESKFERMHLRVNGVDLVPSWPWDMDAFRKGAERGVYTRE
ncbi:MAG: hypothetical protein ACJ8GK_00210 [Luteimonas sp.]